MVLGDVMCWADPNRVRQIIRNLVSNAIKHGGPTVNVYLESDGERAVLTVSDNGEAMEPEVEQRMFDRFVHDGVETLLTGSVGLGLSIARSLAMTRSKFGWRPSWHSKISTRLSTSIARKPMMRMGMRC